MNIYQEMAMLGVLVGFVSGAAFVLLVQRIPFRRRRNH